MIIVFIRTLIQYFLIVFVMRIMGKRQMGEMQPFELVVAIMISELASDPITDNEIPLLNGIIPILTLLLAQVSLAYFTLKSNKARKFVCGGPSILINQGKVCEGELRRLRININDLLEQLRVKNYPNISDVYYAILETNGQMSIIPKSQSRPVITKDLGIQDKDPDLPLTLIIDGNIIYNNLQICSLTKEELLEKLQSQGISSVKELLFVIIDGSGNLIWQHKENFNA